MKPVRLGLAIVAAGLFAAGVQSAVAANVKITPLGSHEGELCPFDRAMIFEDPDGTRILYDAGRTVAGPDDPRLGKIDALLVSHMHGDHAGDRRIPKPSASECGKPNVSVSTVPNTNTVEIAIGKKAKIVTGSEMPTFFAGKLKALGADPKDSILVRFGASKKIGGVTITTVPATHSNGISGAMVGGDLGKMMGAAGLTAYAGPPTGYILTFTNGLVMYLSGDTGITAEQDTTVRQHYKAKLVVMNIGDTFTTGPKEAAFVVNELIKPTEAIATHINQVGTKDGKVIPGSRPDIFAKAAKMPVRLSISGKTLEYDGNGKCVAGC